MYGMIPNLADMYQMSESTPMTTTPEVCEESDSKPWCCTSPSAQVELSTSSPPPPPQKSSFNFVDSPSDESITTEILSLPPLLHLQPQPIPRSQITNTANFNSLPLMTAKDVNPNEGEEPTTTTPQVPRLNLRMRRSNRIPNHVTVDQHHSEAAQAKAKNALSGEKEGHGTVKTEEKLERFR